MNQGDKMLFFHTKRDYHTFLASTTAIYEEKWLISVEISDFPAKRQVFTGVLSVIIIRYLVRETLKSSWLSCLSCC